MKDLNEDERLAAFLDGRLDEHEREAMLAHLTTDDDAYEVFAHAAEVLRLAEGGDAAVGAPEDETIPDEVELLPAEEPPREGVISLQERAQARASAVEGGDASRGLAVPRWLYAAVLVGVALASWALWPRPPQGGPVRLAARLEHVPRGLSTQLADSTPWSAARGDVPASGASPEEQVARAADAGGLLLDLAVAVQGRDTSETRLLAQLIADLYDQRTTGPRGALREIIDGAGSPPDQLRPRVEQATEQVVTRLGRRDALQLGAWLEAARFATATRDAGFFNDDQTDEMLDGAAQITASNPPARAAVEQVRGLLDGAGPPHWDELAAAIDDLIQKIVSA